MLNRSQFEDLIHQRLPESKALEVLQHLSPEAVDIETLRLMIEVIKDTADHGHVLLPQPTCDVIDCCGTGGSGLSRYNTSTTVAFVLAAGGVSVAKSGGRAVTSLSGSSDLLEALGFPLDLPLNYVGQLLKDTGIAFFHASTCYPILNSLREIRRKLGMATVFNFIGPLLNPVCPRYRLLGVSDSSMKLVLARLLMEDGLTKRALLVRADDGLDEISPIGITRMLEIGPNKMEERIYTGQDRSVSVLHPKLSISDNVRIFRHILTGEDDRSLYYQTVLLNSGAGFYITHKTQSIDEGCVLAQALLAGGQVAEYFERVRRSYVRFSS